MINSKIVIIAGVYLAWPTARQEFSSSVKVGFSSRLENPTTGKTPPLRLTDSQTLILADQDAILANQNTILADQEAILADRDATLGDQDVGNVFLKKLGLDLVVQSSR